MLRCPLFACRFFFFFWVNFLINLGSYHGKYLLWPELLHPVFLWNGRGVTKKSFKYFCQWDSLLVWILNSKWLPHVIRGIKAITHSCSVPKWQPVLKSYGTDNQWNHAVLTAEDQFLMAANAVRSCVLCLNYSAIDLSRNIVPSSLPSYHTYSLATYSPASLASICSLRALLDFIHLEHY